jgi:hypothetical protein
MSDFPSQQQDKFVLRLPDGLRDRIKEKADDNIRSMNAEIVQLLEREYPAPTDVMHIHLDNIRRLLDLYESETDPKERLRFQKMVEAMTKYGDDFEITFGEK